MPNTTLSDLDREAPDAVTNPSAPTNAGILRGWAGIMETGGFSDPEDIPWLVKHLRAAADELSALPRASGVPEAEAPCTDCNGTGITTQTERPCSCDTGMALKKAEPVAWVFQLACAHNSDTGEYTHWAPPKLSFSKPNVPEGAVRFLRALYASPPPVVAPSGEAKVISWTDVPERPFHELPDDLRQPLHSLQADLDWLLARYVTEDNEGRGMLKSSIINRLSQIESASYRLANPFPSPIASEPKDAGKGEGQDWQLVPKQATQEMVNAAQMTHTSDLCDADIEDIYETMLRNIPAPEGKE